MRDSENREIERPPQQNSEKAHPEPKRDHRKLRRGVLISMSVAIIVLLILFAALYFLVGGLKPTAPCCLNPTGRFESAEATSNTTATVEFAGFSLTPAPEELTIVVETSLSLGLFGFPLLDSFYLTFEGTYFFPDNDDGVQLLFERGFDLADVQYKDYADNELVNGGDVLRLSGLGPGMTYTVKCLWEDGTELDSITFEMPDD